MAGRRRKKDDIHETPDVSHIQNPDVSHEASDVDVGTITKFVIGLFILTIISFALMWLLYNVLEERAAQADPPRRPMAMTEEERLPPEPRLQAAPGFGVDTGDGQRINLELREPQAEMNELRKIWERQLKGEPDPQTGVATMPIKEAMQKLLETGGAAIQSRQQQNGQPQQQQLDISGMDIPSFQSGGRMTEKRDQ